MADSGDHSSQTIDGIVDAVVRINPDDQFYFELLVFLLRVLDSDGEHEAANEIRQLARTLPEAGPTRDSERAALLERLLAISLRVNQRESAAATVSEILDTLGIADGRRVAGLPIRGGVADRPTPRAGKRSG